MAIFLSAATPTAFARQMESTSRDPFATIEACGHRRADHTRLQLAGCAVGTGGGAIELFPLILLRQLSGRAPCRHAEGRRGGGRLLSVGVARRPAQQRAA